MLLTLQAPTLALYADCAMDLMTRDPLTVHADAGVRDAMILFLDRNITAAPVVDDEGCIVGVLSRTDILNYQRENSEKLSTSDYYTRSDLRLLELEMPRQFQIEHVDATAVREIMNPMVLTVPPETSPADVVAKMIGLHVHRLFVADEEGMLLGVITAFDILKHLETMSN
jgi:CBS domain-containing protein